MQNDEDNLCPVSLLWYRSDNDNGMALGEIGVRWEDILVRTKLGMIMIMIMIMAFGEINFSSG